MADEIVAKYRVDVSGASASLDQLAAKTQKTGQTLDDSFNKGSDGVKRLQSELAKQPKTLADLELRLVKLKELLRDDTKIGTEGFKQVTKAINDTNAAIKQANASLEETPKKTNIIVDGFKKLGAAMLAAFAADRIVAFAKEAVELAAKAEGVERAFKKIGSADLLNGLRSATRGTVTDLVLMQSAVKADNFKIPLDQLGSLLKYAQMQARATGQDVDYLVESLITGIGRKSVLVLDNLQISAVELREKLGDVSLEAATVGQVAEAVGTIASASFAKMGEQALTTADKIAKVKTAFDNFKVAVGKEIILQFADLNDEIAKTGEILGKSDIDAASLALKGLGLVVKLLLTPFSELNWLIQQNAKIFAFFKGLFDGDELETGSNQLTALQKGFADIRKLIDENNKAKEADNATTKKQIENLFFVNSALKLLNEEMELEGTSLERITAILPEILRLEEQRRKILGEETLAAKAARIAKEELLKIEQKRAEDYNKAQSEEAERLLKQEEDNAKERVKIAEDMAKMLIDIERYLATTSEEIRDVDLADNQRQYEKDLKDVINAGAEKVLEGEKLTAQLQAITDAKNKADEDAQKAHNDRILGLNKDKNDSIKDQDAELAAEKQKKLDDELDAIVTYTGVAVQVVGLIAQAQQQQNDYEFALLDERLERGLITQEEYDNKRRQLMQKQAEDAKTVAVFSAILGGIVAVVNAFRDGGPVLAAITAALVAIEVGLAIATPVPQFAKGVVDLQGEGTGTSDSISAKLSKGESVITAKETSKHKGLLEAMNKGLAEKYILSNYVKPALDSAMLSGFTDIGKSAEINGLTANLKDHNIIAAMDRNRQATVQGLKIIAERMSNQKAAKRGGYA
jgi:hypothetical protein